VSDSTYATDVAIKVPLPGGQGPGSLDRQHLRPRPTLAAPFLTWLGQRLGTQPGMVDVVLAHVGDIAGGAPLVRRTDPVNHPRVARALPFADRRRCLRGPRGARARDDRARRGRPVGDQPRARPSSPRPRPGPGVDRQTVRGTTRSYPSSRNATGTLLTVHHCACRGAAEHAVRTICGRGEHPSWRLLARPG